MISLLSEKYTNRHYTGLDLTLAMIEQAKKKNILNVDFVVGDCEKILYVYRFASLIYHKGFFSNDILKNYILLNISLDYQSLKNN